MNRLLVPGTDKGIGFDRVWAMVEPASPFGREEKAKARPFLPGDEQVLEAELDRVEAARRACEAAPGVLRALQGRLSRCRDLRGSVLAAGRGAVLDVVELYELKRFASLCRELDALLERFPWERPADLKLGSLEALSRALDPQGRGAPGFYVDDAFSPVLARVRRHKRAVEATLERERRRQASAVAERLGLPVDADGEIAVSTAESDRVRMARRDEDLLLVREAGGHLYFRLRPGPRAREAERVLADLRERERQEEGKVRAKLSCAVADAAPVLLENMGVLGRLDFLLARARLARQVGGTRPRVLPPGQGITLQDARHVAVEQDLGRQGRRFTPLTLELAPGAAVLTGPNMGGKTVALQTLGLGVAMAQMGLLVPAARMEWSLVAFVYYGGQEGQRPGLSAFAAEVSSLAEPLGRRGEGGLLLLDEFAKGTNPREGRALSAAVLRCLATGPSVCLLATHHSGLAELVGTPHWQVRGLGHEVLTQIGPGDGVRWLYEHMDYRLEKVSPHKETPHEALLVARLLGLDEQVLAFAERYLGQGSEKGEGNRLD